MLGIDGTYYAYNSNYPVYPYASTISPSVPFKSQRKVYDTAGILDDASTRIMIPAGTSFARISWRFQQMGTPALFKNGARFNIGLQSIGTIAVGIVSSPVAVQAGD
mmetsp:Transcript_13069/g.33661  ORF Transcript_13069/g.33661 Transcript_13069/m.33661 type:complete len:106 (-) Transcript_13069:243-560(-)